MTTLAVDAMQGLSLTNVAAARLAVVPPVKSQSCCVNGATLPLNEMCIGRRAREQGPNSGFSPFEKFDRQHTSEGPTLCPLRTWSLGRQDLKATRKRQFCHKLMETGISSHSQENSTNRSSV